MSTDSAKQTSLTVETPRKGVTAISHGGVPLATHNQGPHRPYWHPLRLPDGRCVSLAHPHDHVWHCGLYHCPKFVDDVSLWEPEFHQHRAASNGQSELAPEHHGHGAFGELQTKDFDVSLVNEQLVRIDLSVVWQRLDQPELLGRERQRWALALDDSADGYCVLLELTLEAQGGDRRIWAGEHGYSGFSWRSPRDMNGGEITTDEGNSLSADLHNGPARWVNYTAALDGLGLRPGTSEPIGALRHDDENRWAGVTMMSHRDNAASSFFTLGHFGFMAAQLGYPEPHLLRENQSLRLIYGLYVHAGRRDANQLAAAYERFQSLSSKLYT